MTQTVLDSLPLWQLLLLGLCFVWSGFVRSGIGFGGAALSLSLLLKVHKRIVSGDRKVFERFIGGGLIVVTLLGLFNLVGVQ